MKDGSTPMVPMSELWHFADFLDWFLMFLGSVAGIATGVAMPVREFGLMTMPYAGTNACGESPAIQQHIPVAHGRCHSLFVVFLCSSSCSSSDRSCE